MKNKFLKLLCKIFGHSWYKELNHNIVKSSWEIPYVWTSPWRRHKIYRCERCGFEKKGESKFVPE